MISAEVVDAARMVRVENVCDDLKLRRIGRELVGPCPRCGGDDRFAVHTVKQMFNCRQCHAKGNVITLAKHIYGIGFREAVEMLAGPMRALKAPTVTPVASKRVLNANLDYALAIWDESRLWAATPVKLYLALRDVILPPACTCIRYHAHCPFREGCRGRHDLHPRDGRAGDRHRR